MSKHVHHDIIQEWIKDTSRVVEIFDPVTNRWFTEPRPNWNPACQWRFKPNEPEPKYIVVNGVNVPEPVREPLEDGQRCWLSDISASWPTELYWHDNAHHKHWLSLGLIHLTREAAQAHINAMLLPSRSYK